MHFGFKMLDLFVQIADVDTFVPFLIIIDYFLLTSGFFVDFRELFIKVFYILFEIIRFFLLLRVTQIEGLIIFCQLCVVSRFLLKVHLKLFGVPLRLLRIVS